MTIGCLRTQLPNKKNYKHQHLIKYKSAIKRIVILQGFTEKYF